MLKEGQYGSSRSQHQNLGAAAMYARVSANEKRIRKAQGRMFRALPRRTGQDFQSPWRFCRTELLCLFVPDARLSADMARLSQPPSDRD
jgi:hypothetical protein